MTSIIPKKMTDPSDFFACPIWRYDEDDDLYHPVIDKEDIPESERDISILATFITPRGLRLDGYVVGISRVFSIGLFSDGRFYHANKNLGPESREWMNDFIASTGDDSLRSLSDLLPLRYTTCINRVEYKDFTGTFDLE